MGYIESIRKLIGNEPVILNSAGAIIENKAGEVLLEYRNDTSDWGIPGGYMELGETFEETLQRELQEEIKVELQNLRLYHVFSGKTFFHEYPNGDKVYSVIAIFTASLMGERIYPDHQEIKKAAFFPWNELPAELTKTTNQILSLYKKLEKT